MIRRLFAAIAVVTLAVFTVMAHPTVAYADQQQSYSQSEQTNQQDSYSQDSYSQDQEDYSYANNQPNQEDYSSEQTAQNEDQNQQQDYQS